MLSRVLLSLWIVLAACVAAPAGAAPRVLIVVSGNGADAGKTRPGFEMDELAQAHAVFSGNGLAVDLASPAGGAVVADTFDAAKPYNQRFLQDPRAVALLGATRALATVREADYAAIFIIGGKGAMFDLPVDASLKALLARTYASGGVIGAVCHGPAVLANVPLADGGTLVRGRKVTGFSNAEEMLFGKRWAASFPVLLEDGLRGAGADYSAAPMMLTHVVVDGRLVTGQNPYSTAAAAEAVVRAMGRIPVTRAAWRDEFTIEAVQRIIAGDGSAVRAQLTADPGRFDVPLMASWGAYRAKSVGDDREALAKAIDVMEVAAPFMREPRLTAAIADARVRLAAGR